MKKRILVVEDDETLAMLNKELLEYADFDVDVAYSGNQALDFLKNNSVDVILSDVRMPNGDGVFLLKNLTSLQLLNDTIFFFYTGYHDFSESEAISMGAKGVFKKPINIGEILKRLS